MELSHQLKKEIEQANEKVAILVQEMNTNEEIVHFLADKQLVSASLIKVLIMLVVLDEVNKGNGALHQKLTINQKQMTHDTQVFKPGEYTLEELIYWMIVQSDNTATNVLIDFFGMKKINDYCQHILQLSSTKLQRKMLDSEAVRQGFNNYTSHRDMFKLFTLLFNGEILTKELCDVAMRILYQQKDCSEVNRYLDQNCHYAHKTGNLDYLSHDAGIMTIGDKYYYIGISVFDSQDIDGNKPLMGQLGKLIYDYLSEKQ